MNISKNFRNNLFLFGSVIFILNIVLIVISKSFAWENTIWFLISISFVYITKNNKVKNYFRQKVYARSTDLLFQEFTRNFFILFSIKIVLDIMTKFLQNYLLYVNILEILVMIAMAYLIGKYAFEYGRKKIYWIFGLLGFIWFATIGIFLGYFTILELKTEKDQEVI